METLIIKILKIGNSKGIVIPQRFLKIIENGKDEIQMNVDEEGIHLKSNKQTPRKGWAKAFKKMAKNNDDKLLVPDIFGDEKIVEWK